jgi:hypothetical protein
MVCVKDTSLGNHSMADDLPQLIADRTKTTVKVLPNENFSNIKTLSNREIFSLLYAKKLFSL